MQIRSRRAVFLASAAVALAVAGLPAATERFPIEDVRPGMTGVGRTVFEGDRLDEFQVHIIGVLRNVIGPQRNLVLARLEGGPLADTGVIAGMSGSPVYIDGRLLGAVSYSLGAFSKAPIAGITPIDEMTEVAAMNTPRRQLARVDVAVPLTVDGLRDSVRQAFAWLRPFADRPEDARLIGGDGGIGPGVGTLLRPIATPLTLSGFSAGTIAPLAAALQDAGLPATVARGADDPADPPAPLRPGDPVGVTLLDGDLEIGATGTVTHVDGDAVYAFGHAFYNLGPTQFPMTRARVHTVLPSLQSSMKIASMGQVIGTIRQDRSTAIAGTLGEGPPLIPITLRLTSERGINRTMRLRVVNDQLFTPLMTYLSIVETLTSYERQTGAASYVIRGSATLKDRGALAFENLFSGEQASAGAAGYVMTPINVLLRNAFEDVRIEALDLEIVASEEPRTATLERAWIDSARVRAGTDVPLRVLLRTYRGEEVTRTVPIRIPPNARGAVSVLVSDAARLAQVEGREASASRTRDLPQMLRVLNDVRKSNRLYVRLVSADGGAVVRGETLESLPSSVLAVMEGDRSGGSFRSLGASLSGDWEIPMDYVVEGSRTLTLPLDRR